jgi:hypothetical protein
MMMMRMRMRMMRLGIKIRFPLPVGPSSCRCHYCHYYNNYRQISSISKKSLFPSQQFGSSFLHERRRSLNVHSNNDNDNNDNNNNKNNNDNNNSNNKNNNNLDEKNNEDERSVVYNRNDDSNDNMNPLLSFSSINETPIGSTILEKPFTVILMEDSEYSMSRKGNDNNNNNNNSADEDDTLCISWMETFRSKIPRKYGMSFGSISIDRRRRRQQQNRPDCNGDDGDDEPVLLLFDELLKSLKHSDLPSINDAVLIARGPVASLCAQYYLESCSLQGLIMIDPILINDNPRNNNNDGDDDDDDDDTIALLRSRILHDNEHDQDQDRFRSKKLLIESNSVPMMVVLTVPNNKVWNRASRFVATRHSNPDGPYGMVEIIDLTTATTANEKKKNKNKNDHDVNNKIIDEAESSSSTVMMIALDQINRWIDETL